MLENIIVEPDVAAAFGLTRGMPQNASGSPSGNCFTKAGR